jgi:hypothetical protein
VAPQGAHERLRRHETPYRDAAPPLVEQLVSLQRSAGNAAVARLAATGTQPGVIQRMGVFKARQLLQNDDREKKEGRYMPILGRWGRLSSDELQNALGPLETIEELRVALDRYAETPEGQYTESQVKKIVFERSYGDSPVFQSLIEGVEAKTTDAARLDTLFDNFKRLGPTIFEYTMAAKPWEGFLKGQKEGDCNTVVRAFRTIAEEYLGIEAKHKTSADVGHGGRFIAPQATTIDGKTGNVDDGAFWLFDNHFWIEAAGKQYDVLFGKLGVDPGAWTDELGRGDDPAYFGKTTSDAKKIRWTQKTSPIKERWITIPSDQ